MKTKATATSTDTMRAITQSHYGTSEVLRLARVPRPAVRDDQVLIHVHAAGLDRGTEHLMSGKPYAVRLGSGIRRPRNPVPGRDVAGTVVEVGDKVTRFSPGDQVYGVAPGSFTEFAVAGEDRLAHQPANLSFAEAAVIPISAGTALQALTDAGKVPSRAATSSRRSRRSSARSSTSRAGWPTRRWCSRVTSPSSRSSPTTAPSTHAPERRSHWPWVTRTSATTARQPTPEAARPRASPPTR